MMHILPKNNIPDPVRFLIYIVICPTLLAAVYYGLIASDIYISEARYAIHTNSGSSTISIVDSILPSGMTGTSSANEDAQIVKEYSLSHSMLALLDESLKIREHYSSQNVDFLSRFDDEDSTEDFLEYYRKMVVVSIDSTSNITTLRVRAFAPEMAAVIAQTIINISEKLVNRISDRMVNDFLKFARDEVSNAEERIKATSRELTDFRSKNRSIDPGQETSAVLGIVTELETKLAAARTELLEAMNFMQENSLQIRVLEGKVKALKEQAKRERTRLANEESNSTDYTRLIDLYEPLILEQELAKEFYSSALASLELARAEARRKQRYLLPFVEPIISDEAVEPERIYAISTIFVMLLLAYAIGSLVWAAIKDHMRI